MTTNFAAAMRRAALSTRAYDPIEATRIIQDALAQQPKFLQSAADSKRPLSLRLIDPGVEIIPSSRTQYEPGQRKPLGDVLRILKEGKSRFQAFEVLRGFERKRSVGTPPPPIPDGAQFIARSFTCAAGTRSYKLYIPASAPTHPNGLIVMLHGCKQNPDDFASGTAMNAVAEKRGLIEPTQARIPRRMRPRAGIGSARRIRCAREVNRLSSPGSRSNSFPSLASLMADHLWPGYRRAARWRRSWGRPILISTPASAFIPGWPMGRQQTWCPPLQPCAVTRPELLTRQVPGCERLCFMAARTASCIHLMRSVSLPRPPPNIGREIQRQSGCM
jgi:Esterase PHB depolymerase